MINSIPSFEKINYLLRPKKQIERKIIIEILQKIQIPLKIDISKYNYIGMGSIYYYDYILFHKFLGISNMVSIDDKDCENRFLFNIPYDEIIKFHNKKTTEYLTEVDIKENSMIWFDYDSKFIKCYKTKYGYKIILNKFILDDLKIISKKCKQNVFFITTVNMNIREEYFEVKTFRDSFVKQMEGYLSDGFVKQENIIFNNFAEIIQNIFLNIFANEGSFNKIKFNKIFSFSYNDGSPMYTIGGFFTDNEISDSIYSCSKYINKEELDINKIDVPILTIKEKLMLDKKVQYFQDSIEKLHLERKLEKEVIKNLGFEIEYNELKNYLEYYRFYPQYYEGLI